MSIYSPKNIDEAKYISELLANKQNSPQDLLRLHACFGHHFEGNIAVTAQQSYMIKGTPSLRADAIHAIARKSGLVRFVRVASLDHTHCTYEMARNDEPADVVHAWTFTYEMAEHQGLTRNRPWQQMPMQMLRARALTFGLRGTFPEAVSGIYSADEIADNTVMNDDDRADLSASSLGEKLEKVEKKTKVNMSTGEVLETPVAAQGPAQVKAHGYNFDTVDGFWAACKHKKLSKEHVEHALLVQKANVIDATPRQRSDIFYLVCCTPAFRHSKHLLPPNNLASMVMLLDRLKAYAGVTFGNNPNDEYKALTERLKSDAWHESLMLIKGTSGNYKSGLSQSVIAQANDILKEMWLGDWSQYDRIQAMIKDPSSFDDSSNVQAESIPF